MEENRDSSVGAALVEAAMLIRGTKTDPDSTRLESVMKDDNVVGRLEFSPWMLSWAKVLDSHADKTEYTVHAMKDGQAGRRNFDHLPTSPADAAERDSRTLDPPELRTAAADSDVDTLAGNSGRATLPPSDLDQKLSFPAKMTAAPQD